MNTFASLLCRFAKSLCILRVFVLYGLDYWFSHFYQFVPLSMLLVFTNAHTQMDGICC